MRSTVEQYLALVANGTAEQIAELYADDAVLEDPVGNDPHVGKDAILAFYKVIEPIERSTQLSLRASGDTAVFEFRIVTVFGDLTIELSPVDIMVFDKNGRIASMRAVWSPDDMIKR
ncbi:MAG: nuclear transport factor 2 family protein [Actinomycetota bacterium]|nr:nuclear transport factor 2 family protein [Actinomycetota bacterium]MDP9165998.1 nuclear transport factor 2 family protein [Actinomycetota bacterium]